MEREIAQWVHPMKDRSDDQNGRSASLPSSDDLDGLLVGTSAVLMLMDVNPSPEVADDGVKVMKRFRPLIPGAVAEINRFSCYTN